MIAVMKPLRKGYTSARWPSFVGETVQVHAVVYLVASVLGGIGGVVVGGVSSCLSLLDDLLAWGGGFG